MPLDLGTPQSTELLVRVLSGAQYLGLLVFAGLWFFRDFLSVRSGLGLAQSPETARGSRILTLAAGTGLLASLLLIPALALRILGESPANIWHPDKWLPGVLPNALQSNLLAAGALLLAALLVCTQERGAGQKMPPRSAAAARGRRRWVVLPVVLLSLAAPGLHGHTAAADPSWVAQTSGLVHLSAGAIWLGGLLGMALLVSASQPSSMQSATIQTTTIQTTTETLARFSNWALGAVVAVSISGVALGLSVLDSPDALGATTYGRTLLFKAAIVVAVVGLAGWNRLVLVPRLRRSATDTHAWRLLHQTLDYEAWLLLFVLLVTGFLANLDPSVHPTALAALAAPLPQN